MTASDDVVRIEAARWQELATLVAELEPEWMEEPTLNAERWSVKDLLWHLAYWCADAERTFGSGASAIAPRPEGEDWFNELNETELERSRSMTLDEVLAAWNRARSAMLDRFAELPEPSPEAIDRLAECGPRHYADHLPELLAFRASRG